MTAALYPIFVPLFPTPARDPHIVDPIRIDGQAEHYNWNKAGLVRTAAAGAMLATRPASQRVIYWGNFAPAETRVQGLDEGGPWTLDPERAAITGEIPAGPTRQMVIGMASVLRAASAKLALTIVNCETGPGRIVDWMLANAGTLAKRRRFPGRVGCALAGAGLDPANAYGTPNYNALMSVLLEYAFGILIKRLAEDLEPLRLLGPVALSFPSISGGVPGWVFPSTYGAPITPEPIPMNLANAPQVYNTGCSPNGIDVPCEGPAWRAMLNSLDGLSALGAEPGRKLRPIFAPPSYGLLSPMQAVDFYRHAARRVASLPIVPIWNASEEPGEIIQMVRDWQRVLAELGSDARREFTPLDYGADSVTSAGYGTKRGAFEALAGG